MPGPPVKRMARAINLTNQRTTNILYPMLAAVYYVFNCLFESSKVTTPILIQLRVSKFVNESISTLAIHWYPKSILELKLNQS